jgi:beta-glucosidase
MNRNVRARYRKNLTAWLNGDALVRAVASQNNNTIVVINSVGPLILEPWIEHPNVTAVVWAGLGGTETGNALADVIYGTVNPSGRLPYTIAKSPKDYPAQLVLGGDGEEILNITYSEGCVFAFPILLSNCLPPPNKSLL